MALRQTVEAVRKLSEAKGKGAAEVERSGCTTVERDSEGFRTADNEIQRFYRVDCRHGLS